MDHWITHFGYPQSLHYNQRRNFEANLSTSVSKFCQLDETLTSATHLESNTVTERIKQMLLNMMAKTMDENQRSW